MFRGIFPKTHWNDLLDSLVKQDTQLVEIEINRDGVVVDHALVSFISEVDEELILFVTLNDLLKTRTLGLVELKYFSNEKLLVADDTNRQEWLIDLVRPIYLH
jgi:hypothetical protein